jgi:hypothetical protein
MHRLISLLPLSPLALMLGCSPCVNVSQLSDTSSGSYVYVVSNAPMPGSVTSKSTFAVADLSTTPTSNSAIEFAIEPSSDASSNGWLVTLDGVESGASVPLGRASEVCNENGVCYPLSGTLTNSNFSTTCPVSGQACGLTLSADLKASAFWGGGSLTITATLQHQDQTSTEACQAEGS